MSIATDIESVKVYQKVKKCEITTCTYCEKMFSSRSSLINHLRTVETCIAKQEANGIKVKKYEMTCEGCKKPFKSSSTFKYHLQICKVRFQQILEAERAEKESLKKQIELERLDKEVLKLRVEEHDRKFEEILEKMDAKPSIPAATITNTNSNNHMKNSHNTTNNNITIQNWMTEERILEIFQKNFKRIEQLNPKDLAHFTVNHLVNGADRPLYLCTDPSRQRMVYFDGSGNEQVDESCKTLIEKVLQAKPYLDEIIQDDIVDKTQEEIDKVKPYHDAFSNLQQSRNYKLELSKQLPRTVESARKPKRVAKPEPDGDGWENGVDWKINEKMKKQENTAETERKKWIEETENHDVWGFFPTQTEEDDDM